MEKSLITGHIKHLIMTLLQYFRKNIYLGKTVLCLFVFNGSCDMGTLDQTELLFTLWWMLFNFQ